ncbi:hypothetical protein A5646_03500 [Mycobacterium sp. 1245499.0]|uniref:Gp19/Gp15/Gp42 family protein n=1 Tax=Mycobacterium sp. 1245499.0 TaxID=1834074 RepID=UPI0007FEC758|nr:Gp19/Gp15/Gp42 family protein [Mycobacterium sp. 1245499.0]OBK92379.1 hypothetical protein A5646_03500 [Mycobacterium sp. 1245499.0]
MTAYATLADLEARYTGQIDPTTAETLLDDASFWLGVWVPGLDAAVTTSSDVATAAKLLVVAMVKRALAAQAVDVPGVQSITNSGGPFNQSITYRNPEGNLYLYANELESITSLLRSTRAAAVSMRSPGL